MLELLSIPYSPWSEKARWALDARGVEYTKRNYLPLVGEPQLRILLRQPFGHVSVPVLIDSKRKRVIKGSLEIARFADTRSSASSSANGPTAGSGARLFPEGSESAIVDYDAASERGLSAGRALSLLRMLDDREALAEQVPRQLSTFLGPLAIPVARAGVERTLRKYRAASVSVAEHRSLLASVFTSLRADLSRSKSCDEPRTLLPQFSYADIVMAQLLTFVEVPQTPHLRIGPASRRCFGDSTLRSEFPDLVAWRDALYLRYRDARQPASPS